jgi:hypothetical protein
VQIKNDVAKALKLHRDAVTVKLAQKPRGGIRINATA